MLFYGSFTSNKMDGDEINDKINFEEIERVDNCYKYAREIAYGSGFYRSERLFGIIMHEALNNCLDKNRHLQITSFSSSSDERSKKI